MRNIGQNKLKEVLDGKGIKNSWVYEKLDIPRATFYNYLSNKTQPSNVDLKRIAELLEVTMEDLVD